MSVRDTLIAVGLIVLAVMLGSSWLSRHERCQRHGGVLVRGECVQPVDMSE